MHALRPRAAAADDARRHRSGRTLRPDLADRARGHSRRDPRESLGNTSGRVFPDRWRTAVTVPRRRRRFVGGVAAGFALARGDRAGMRGRGVRARRLHRRQGRSRPVAAPARLARGARHGPRGQAVAVGGHASGRATHRARAGCRRHRAGRRHGAHARLGSRAARRLGARRRYRQRGVHRASRHALRVPRAHAHRRSAGRRARRWHARTLSRRRDRDRRQGRARAAARRPATHADARHLLPVRCDRARRAAALCGYRVRRGGRRCRRACVSCCVRLGTASWSPAAWTCEGRRR
jgi:hypothetical protein